MDKLIKVLELLNAEGINASIYDEDYKSVKWVNPKGDEYDILESDIAFCEDKIAWFQSSYEDDHLLVTYENGIRFQWVPETYNPVFGCECIYLGWRKGALIFIYLEKHDIYVCSIKGTEVKRYNFHGDHLCIGNDYVSIAAYGYKDRNEVELLSLPDLKKKTVSLDCADKLGLRPVYYLG